MSTPVVTEIHHRLEPVTRDTFIDRLATGDRSLPEPASAARAGSSRA